MKKRMLDNRGASLYITLLVVIVLVFLSMSLLITIHTSSQKLNANTKEQLLKLELENVAYEYLNQLSLDIPNDDTYDVIVKDEDKNVKNLGIENT